MKRSGRRAARRGSRQVVRGAGAGGSELPILCGARARAASGSAPDPEPAARAGRGPSFRFRLAAPPASVHAAREPGGTLLVVGEQGGQLFSVWFAPPFLVFFKLELAHVYNIKVKA